jgi:hypothetical protein
VTVFCGVNVDPAARFERGALGGEANPAKPRLPGEVELDRDQSRVKRLRRCVRQAAELHRGELGRSRRYAVFLTLTYRNGADWRPQHVASFFNTLRKWWARFQSTPLRYVWVAELQERGAVHYHAVLWLPPGVTIPKPDKRGWWPHGSTNTKAAHSPVGYICKYASKCTTARGFPKGCRLYGVGGLTALRPVYTWRNLPGWARACYSIDDRARRVSGGGMDRKGGGDWRGSPWRSWLYGGAVLVRQVFSYCDAVGAAGPWSRLERV